mmetsp:Transcript_45381/g.102766  ORF Transcript_45381/g.102766 Transcript_45381/m.102766 type:complete len:91 (+) Transcript_45381:1238-1510(+)
MEEWPAMQGNFVQYQAVHWVRADTKFPARPLYMVSIDLKAHALRLADLNRLEIGTQWPLMSSVEACMVGWHTLDAAIVHHYLAIPYIDIA